MVTLFAANGDEECFVEGVVGNPERNGVIEGFSVFPFLRHGAVGRVCFHLQDEVMADV